jgi:hypothetical protein
MNIIQCYTPTNKNDEDMKEQFYSRLQRVIEIPSGRDMGDLNA